jgi:hypothetical protein
MPEPRVACYVYPNPFMKLRGRDGFDRHGPFLFTPCSTERLTRRGWNDRLVCCAGVDPVINFLFEPRGRSFSEPVRFWKFTVNDHLINRRFAERNPLSDRIHAHETVTRFGDIHRSCSLSLGHYRFDLSPECGRGRIAVNRYNQTLPRGAKCEIKSYPASIQREARTENKYLCAPFSVQMKSTVPRKSGRWHRVRNVRGQRLEICHSMRHIFHRELIRRYRVGTIWGYWWGYFLKLKCLIFMTC